MKHWLLSLTLMLCTPALADLRLDNTELIDISQTSMLLISGNNLTASDVIIVIRADDTKNPGYSDRANIERVIPQGSFELQIPFASLRTPSGRQLDLNKLQQIIVFSGNSERGFALSNARIETPKPLGENVYAWDLGPVGSAIWPGFQPLTIKSGLLTGPGLNAIDRGARAQAADALTIDGIRGIESAALPLPAGNWQITLWLRDAGEWEYLPHPLQRKINANGEPVFTQNMSPTEWIENVYLGRRNVDISPNSSSWTHYGERKSDRVTFNISSDGNPVILRLSGKTTDAQFMSGILAVPQSNPLILDMLTRQRKVWWEKNWPIANWKKWPTGQPRLQTNTTETNVAPGTSAVLQFAFEQGNIPGAPMVMLRQPVLNGVSIPANWHWSQWQLTRTHLSSTLLEANDDFLRYGLMPENEGVAMPRRMVIRVDVPTATPPGIYHGELFVMMQGKSLKAPFSINVVNASLPDMTKPVGIYLEPSVHFGWFKELAAISHQATLCDLTFLRTLGLTGISPPYPTPQNTEALQAFEDMSITLNKMGFRESMAYTPAKRLTQSLGAGNAANVVANIEQQHQQRLQSTPYWSIADEPSNPGNVDLFKDMHRQFSIFAPSAKLAGHLNHDKDREYLSMFDLILINDGYGVDKNEIQQAQRDERKVWLYNLPNPRAAAGFYLWQSDADGFLKWHGRMPTADPFDPTDGREYDVQFLYPSKEPCPEEPDINITLYDIMEGITDYRWVLWLQNKAQTNPDAKRLLTQLKRDVPDTWEAMLKVTPQQMETWRQQIIQLAQ
ncbi:hypothetical protein A1OK_09940 [Enterovibrio norvegicus FF-454]|uniref:Glycoside hydrolase 123 catalytic domain-containing protein n=1 Tax=Enterovibrio norvegicus FF-454 TaxID=1185651 RepID=A0A1E5C5P4_9GAMM|nr:hypothetical protein [Enterovibrio norvegicus]OEE60851.1 hypothetical protein A1OK_09940 [Enterovibrio norvegicus FF-454]